MRAAQKVMATYGYPGGTTEAVAAEAGVSQPYVIRVFGSKKELFIEALNLTYQEIMDSLEQPLSPGADPEEVGKSYVELGHQSNVAQFVAQVVMASNDPEFAQVARKILADVYKFVRENAGFDAEQAQAFLANGMLFNTLVLTSTFDHVDERSELREIIEVTLGPEYLSEYRLQEEPESSPGTRG